MRDQLDQLAAEVKAAGLTRPEIEGILYRLSPAQRRLFLRLSGGPALTTELRTVCSIGNVSEAARDLNAKLQRVADARRVVCAVRPHRNQFGEQGKLGEWRLVEGGGELVAA